MDIEEIIKDLDLLWDMVHSADSTVQNIPGFIQETARYVKEIEKQVREDERKKIRDLLLQDIEDLGLIWGDGTGKDDEMVQSSKAFGWQLVLRVFDRIKAKYNN